RGAGTRTHPNPLPGGEGICPLSPWERVRVRARPRAALLAILLLIALPPIPALSAPTHQSPAVTLDVEAGFGGYYKGSDWLPVFVTIANTGDAFNGLIVLEFPDQRGANTQFSRPVDLPRGSKK